jgi:hypothetical protein
MTLKLVHSRPAADATQLHLAMLGDRLTDAAIREDLVQTLISAADLDRVVRSLGPQQRAAAEQARALIARALEILEAAMQQGQAAARRDPRQTAYTAAAR